MDAHVQYHFGSLYLLLLLSSLNRANCSARANYLYAAITDTTNTEKSRRTLAVSHRIYNPQKAESN